MSDAKRTKDHAVIRDWAEKRGGEPATVAETIEDDTAGILRIDFGDGEDRDNLTPIEWDMFFQKFDEEDLTFLYQEETAEGQVSRFCKFIRDEG